MDKLAESGAALVISGPALDPEAVTRSLGAGPTAAARRGEEIRFPGGGHRRAEVGRWERRATSRRPGDLDAQIAALFAGLTPDPAPWQDLAARFTVDLQATLYLDATTEWTALAPETSRLLAARGVTLRLEIFAPFTPAGSCGG